VNKFHRKRRAASSINDPLENVPGLGAKKLQNLLRFFGGRKGINHATFEELTKVPGIGIEMAKRIIEHLN
jgi:excinuclease ABC subunit C